MQASDGDEQEQHDEQDEEDGAGVGPAAAPEQVGEKQETRPVSSNAEVEEENTRTPRRTGTRREDCQAGSLRGGGWWAVPGLAGAVVHRSWKWVRMKTITRISANTIQTETILP